MKSWSYAFAAFALVLLSCHLPDRDAPYVFDPDPDPDAPELILTEPIFVVANVDGVVIGFDARDPAGYSVLTDDASISTPECRIAIAPDRNHLLYNSASGDHMILITNPTAAVTHEWGGSTDEFFFVDSDNLIYSLSGDIYNYRISTDTIVELVIGPQFGCDHFPVISPDGSQFVFKNQPTNFDGADFMVIPYEPEYGSSTADLLFTVAPDPQDPITVHESLQPVWVDNDTVVLKTSTDTCSTLWVSSAAEGGVSVVFLELASGASASFRNMLISPDRVKMLFYGTDAVYYLDVTTADLSSGSIVVVDLVYAHSAFQTLFAGFSPDSAYFVVGTAHWMGIYDAASLEKMVFDASEVIQPESDDVYETLYSIDAVE